MSSAVETQRTYDFATVPHIVRSAVLLGLIEAGTVFVFSLVSRFLDGPVELALEGVILLVGLAAVAGLPGLWTKARTGDGIAAAAGIGLGATVMFLAVDVTVLQPLGTYTNRWLAIGGGSNWWYHPVWWMVGTFLPWMGATILANQANKTGTPSLLGLMVTALVLATVVGVAAILIHFPGAAWTVPTFAVAFLPGIALAALLTSLGRRPA